MGGVAVGCLSWAYSSDFHSILFRRVLMSRGTLENLRAMFESTHMIGGF